MSGYRVGIGVGLLFIAAVALAAYLIFAGNSPDGGEGGTSSSSGKQHSSVASGGENQQAGAAVEPMEIDPERVLLNAPVGRGEDEKTRLVTVQGRVSRPDDAPLPGVLVSFEEIDSEGEGQFAAAVVESRPDGTYAVRISPGRFIVSAHIRSRKLGHDLWFEPAQVQVPPQEAFLYDIRFTRPLCTIHGKAHLMGRGPLEGVGVGLCNMQGRFIRRLSTGPDGIFEFEGVAPGDYRFLFDRGPGNRRYILPWKESNAPERSPDRWPMLRIKPGEREVWIDLPLSEPMNVVGRVVVPGAVTPQGHLVLLREDSRKTGQRLLGRRRSYSAVVRGDGTVRFNAVFPGPYLVRVHGTPEGRARHDPLSVVLDPLSTDQEQLFAFAPLAGDLKIEGQVIDQQGKPVPDVRLVVWDGDATPDAEGTNNLDARGEVVTGPDGSFLVTGLSPGAYRIRRTIAVAAPGRPILLDASPEVRIDLSQEGTASPVEWKVFAFERTTVRGRIDGLESAITEAGSKAFKVRLTVRVRPAEGAPDYTTTCFPDREGNFVLTRIPRATAPVEFVAELLMEGGKEIVLSRTTVLLKREGDTEVLLKRGGS